MIVGMATVFVFLTLLVGLMQGSAAFFAAFADRFPEPASNPAAEANGLSDDDDNEIAIAIALADAARRGRGI
jgi:sodium pump decarboxylase gamma subunit